MRTFQIMRIDHTRILTSDPPQQPKIPVAEGIIFKSGKVVINWLGDIASVVVHDNIENVIKIHCNGDASLIAYDRQTATILETGFVTNTGCGSVCVGADYLNDLIRQGKYPSITCIEAQKHTNYS